MQDIGTVSIGRDYVAILKNLLLSTVFPIYYLKNKGVIEEISVIEPKRETLEITVDKSHLITTGEKLYTQSIELILEHVNKIEKGVRFIFHL